MGCCRHCQGIEDLFNAGIVRRGLALDQAGLRELRDPSQPGAAGHFGGMAQTGGVDTLAANLGNEQVEKHVPSGVGEDRRIEIASPSPPCAVDRRGDLTQLFVRRFEIADRIDRQPYVGFLASQTLRQFVKRTGSWNCPRRRSHALASAQMAPPRATIMMAPTSQCSNDRPSRCAGLKIN